MKYLTNRTVVALLAACTLAGCTDDTGELGIYPTHDGVSTLKESFETATKSVAMGPVVANNSNAYLGYVVDPETGGIIKAECASQFQCFEDYALPKKAQMVGDVHIDAATGDTTSIEYGVVKCDSCEVRIYLNSYYGDGNNPMKLEVYELNDKKIMEESGTYHTNIDLTQFVKQTKPLATKVFTPTDYILPESELLSDNHTDNIRIMLPASFGQRILEKYYENPSNFKDSYHFIRNVFPGFYFRISNGEGTMIKTQVTTLNLFYEYCDKNNQRKVYTAMSRFSATPEVIQSTRISNSNLEKLLEDSECTYLKTPAGICTEMTLPVDEVFSKHPGDSINQAQITLTRYNKAIQDNYQLGTPASLLMVRKQHVNDFFEKNEVADGRTSYVTSFNSSYNAYTFYNIARLLSYCKHEKADGAKKLGISEAEWETRNPDWNKVVLVPVVTSKNNSTNTLTSVSHDMQMNSIRLIGGKTPINMEVTYTKYSK